MYYAFYKYVEIRYVIIIAQRIMEGWWVELSCGKVWHCIGSKKHTVIVDHYYYKL